MDNDKVKIMGDPLGEHGLTSAELRHFADFADLIEKLKYVGNVTGTIFVEDLAYEVEFGYDASGTFVLLSVKLAS